LMVKNPLIEHLLLYVNYPLDFESVSF
jgi:hypothetical protein